MEQSPYQRLELFWLSKRIKNQSAFADTVPGLTPSALSAMKQRRSMPSNPLMRLIEQAYPKLNRNYILWGTGPMEQDDAAASQPKTSEPLPAVHLSQPTREEYAALQEENRKLREELAKKQGTLTAVEEDRRWLRKQIGGKTEASADAAGEEAPLPKMEAVRNHDYVAPAAQQQAYEELGFKQQGRQPLR